MGKGARNRRDRDDPDAGGEEATYFEAMVSARDGRPFVQMTSTVGGVPVFSCKMAPSVVTALGLRAVQSGIEAERDAGFVAFLRSIDADDSAIGGLLDGLREYRKQFDAAEGSTLTPLADDDPSSHSAGPPEA
jgi:hypothetical protein